MITHPEGQTRSLCRGFFRAEAQSPRGGSRIKRTASSRRDEQCAKCRERIWNGNLHRIMISIRPMNGGLAVTPVALPVGAFPLLEGIFPPGSSDSEKAACLLRLFQMALQSEDDLNRRFDCESSSQTLLSPVMICAPAAKRQASAWEYGAEGRERREDGADDHLPRRANSESVSAQSPRGAAASKRLFA